MADKVFNKEVNRFALNSKKECLENILISIPYDKRTCGSTYRDTIMAKINELDDQLGKSGKRTQVNRKPSAYNNFVKQKLSEVKRTFPELNNASRMKKVSELWNELSLDEKASYASLS